MTIQDLIETCRAAEMRFDAATHTVKLNCCAATVAVQERACTEYVDALDAVTEYPLNGRDDVRTLLRFVADDPVALDVWIDSSPVQDLIETCRAAEMRFDAATHTVKLNCCAATVAVQERACTEYVDALDAVTEYVSAGAKIPHWKRPNGSVAPE